MYLTLNEIEKIEKKLGIEYDWEFDEKTKKGKITIEGNSETLLAIHDAMYAAEYFLETEADEQNWGMEKQDAIDAMVIAKIIRALAREAGGKAEMQNRLYF